MANADVFLKSSRVHLNTNTFNRNGSSVWGWRILLGGVLGALLLSASTQASPLNLAAIASIPSTSEGAVTQFVEDGVYFYGETSQPDELGAGYMVFEAQDNQVIGAVFMPHSSFDCFVGQIGDRQLSMQITNSYTQESYDYAIALVAVDEPIASTGGAVPLQLDGLVDLGAPREAELAMLSICQADVGAATMLNL
ncbi:MAG: hypothetical protein AAFQ89_14395 [Cyanobacteria bacterium J06626_18]